MWLVSLPLLYWMKPPSISLYRQVVLVTLLLTLVGQLFNSFVLTKVISSDKNHAQRDATNQRVFRNMTKRHCFLTISWRNRHVIKTTPVQLFRVHEVLYRNDANTRTLAVTPVAFFPLMDLYRRHLPCSVYNERFARDSLSVRKGRNERNGHRPRKR